MPLMDKLSEYRTTVAKQGSFTVVTYVSTAIVKFDGSTVILNSGGFKTVTTKRKMNQASNQFNLGYKVYQKGGIWFVDKPNSETVEYFDGITFHY